jgi:HPr kinase/phosphorylase
LSLRKVITPDIDISSKKVTVPDINRPALQLAGFFDHFDNERVQIIGRVEAAYISQMDDEVKKERYDKLLSYNIPCIIYCRNENPDEYMIEAARKYKIPLLQSSQVTSSFEAEIIRWMKVQLAPTISIHGVLVDVYGEGVLITGESGIGKSEAALELLKRGHRLVTDDVVEIRKVSDETLIGTAPEITRHFIELRGIGIIDVKTLFGVESVKETQGIDMVIELENWKPEKNYSTTGLHDEYIDILGISVIKSTVPVRPGRNLSIIIETAAITNRQKKMGYNPARELLSQLGVEE